MAKGRILQVIQSSIKVITQDEADFISLTDIARHKDAGHTDDIIKNWMRNRNTIELLGFWKRYTTLI
ncbi:KilA-N domain-containing protein [Parapedobacter composti]|uniref:KilA-N domain-containing protein n=1 Tax=Parapedobacter composti TaxID=623281 RepID=UPI000AB4AD2D|nr:KilA-N domain-containing protein [Parapedobacter composti]